VPECKRRFGTRTLPRSLPDHISGFSAMMVAALPDTRSGIIEASTTRGPSIPRKRCWRYLASISENDGAIRANTVIPRAPVQLAKKLTQSMHPAMQRNYPNQTSRT
jgi:hypothetical protein